jgi:aryl-alcohol dehydrogenase-like predicted oxidoreductase
VEAIRDQADLAGILLPELAPRFILSNPVVTTTITGMRRVRHVEANLAASDDALQPPALHGQLASHRWDRTHNDRP